MAIEWYNINDYVSIGIDWNVTTVTDTSYSIAPIVYRWDSANTDNYASSFSETLNPQPNGEAGYWSGYGWGSGSGTRQVDTFSTRTYEKTTSTQTISLTVEWDSSFGSYYNGSFHTLGSGSYTWTCTIPALASYTVSYNANGGTGAPGNQIKWYGKTLTISDIRPTKEGFSFAGWSSSPEATSVSYSPGSSYIENASLTLYAVWTTNKTCIISYNANGGTGAPTNQNHVYMSTSILSSVRPIRDGYSFLGWSTNSSAAEPMYYAGGGYINNNFENGDTITLYAVWIKIINTYVKIPDGVNLNTIYVNIPSNNSLNAIYYNI